MLLLTVFWSRLIYELLDIYVLVLSITPIVKGCWGSPDSMAIGSSCEVFIESQKLIWQSTSFWMMNCPTPKKTKAAFTMNLKNKGTLRVLQSDLVWTHKWPFQGLSDLHLGNQMLNVKKLAGKSMQKYFLWKRSLETHSKGILVLGSHWKITRQANKANPTI